MREEDVGRVSEAQLSNAMKRDQNLAKTRGAFKTFAGGGRLHMQVSREAVMNAVNTEGRGVMEAAGKGYWEDMKRMYPWTNTMPDTCICTSLRNRHGRVKERTVYHDNGSRTVLAS